MTNSRHARSQPRISAVCKGCVLQQQLDYRLGLAGTTGAISFYLVTDDTLLSYQSDPDLFDVQPGVSRELTCLCPEVGWTDSTGSYRNILELINLPDCTIRCVSFPQRSQVQVPASLELL